MWYVYVILCEDGSLYTGISDKPERRFKDHLVGKGGRYTRSHKPVKLVFKEQVKDKSEALRREMEIKSWSRVEKIEILGIKFSKHADFLFAEARTKRRDSRGSTLNSKRHKASGG